MGMENALTYVGMVMVQLAQVGLMIAGKMAMANGMTTFTFTFYSNAFASLILLPISFFIYRSTRPPLFLTFLCGFFLLGFIGFLVQVLGYAGIKYASASLSTALLNLIPGFIFVFAVILRMEDFNIKSSSTKAKCIGTIVSILGALIVTLYQGPSLLGISSHSNTPFQTLTTSSAWLIGGTLLSIDCVVASIFTIAMALVLKKCPTELILMFFYSCFIAILAATVSLIVEKDFGAWSLKPKKRLIPVIYSALFGNVFQVSVIMWCLKRKGPLFASIFHPLAVIFANVMGIIIFGEPLYLGSIIGSIVVLVGFYFVMWGKAKEGNTIVADVKRLESNGEKMPLLQNHIEDGVIST
ncbi:hypothetical protein BUALT_Bualt17G0050100 [Buddleja alternifolia]|uniref:WAT1-related protein n=1 Tax=Buddleja alternifolia TaxID=168488 RepID=A0AAV6W7T2_9LAMI|nr:hypothetical protein BUALT_Bualt17G0050100 [Buddleja alternifolia]